MKTFKTTNKIVKGSCNGNGCSVPNHIKRTGYDEKIGAVNGKTCKVISRVVQY